MEPNPQDYIKTQLAAGQSVPAIIEALKKSGYSDQQINEAFQQSVGTASTPPPTTETPPMAPKKSFFDIHHLDATKTFVIIGSLLIIIAVVIVLASQWANVGPLTRIAFVGVPMLVLFAIAGALSGKETYEDVHEGTLATAALIFPFALGTTLYQLGIVPEINTLLVVLSSLGGYLLFAVLEYIGRKYRFSLLTLIMLYTFVGSLLTYSGMDPIVVSWLLLLLSIGVTSLGFGLLSQQLPNAGSHIVLGLFASAVLLPSSLLSSLNKEAALPFEFNALLISAFGPIYLVTASGLYELYKKFGNKALYNTKRALEEVAPLVILLPLLAVGANNIVYLLLAIILSFAAMFLSITVRIRSLIPAGALGLIVGIISITGNYFADSLGWPVVVFLSGFAMIGVSFWVRKLGREAKQQTVSAMPYGLGEDPSLVHPDHPRSFGCATILLILLILYGLSHFLSAILYFD